MTGTVDHLHAAVMSRHRSRIAAVAAFVVFLVGKTGSLCAQDFEITPFGGYRFGGDFFELLSGQPLDLDGAPAFGVAIDVPTSPGAQFEALYTRQHAHVLVPGYRYGPPSRWPMTVEQWQAGGLREFDSGNIRPFMTGTLGLTRYATPGDSEIRFGFGGGGGVKLFPSEHLGLRLDTRVFTTFVDAEGQALACSPGICLIGFDASVLWQIEFSAGLVIRFR